MIVNQNHKFDKLIFGKYKMNYFQPKLFSKNDSELWIKSLDEYGFVVIQDILSQDEKKESLDLFKKDMGIVSSKFNTDDPSSLTIENTPTMFNKGMAVFNGFGQSDFMWNIRLNPIIKNIFSTIHKTDDLCVSLDGFSLFVSSLQQSKPWLHIDQNEKNLIYSIQGAYNHFPITEKDAGFICIPKSHKTNFGETLHKKDWIVFDNQTELFSNSVKLIIPENCLVLWNSRLVHSNIGMKKKLSNHLNRLSVYVSFLPKYLRSENILQKKCDAYKNGSTTSHWSNQCQIKQYPFGFKKKFLKRGYEDIQPILPNGEIPIERLNLL